MNTKNTYTSTIRDILLRSKVNFSIPVQTKEDEFLSASATVLLLKMAVSAIYGLVYAYNTYTYIYIYTHSQPD